MTETITGLSALERRIAAVQNPQGVMKLLGTATVREAKLLVHHKTGNLGRSIHVSALSEKSVTVTASAHYAAIVERGSRPHEIAPKAKKALAFASQKITTERFGATAKLNFRLSGTLTAGSVRKYGNAAFVVVKKVHHPGTKPYPFLIPGAKRAVAGSGLRDIIIDDWNGAA